MRAVSLHRDVIVATSRLLAANCTIVRAAAREDPGAAVEHGEQGECFVIDSPVLPDELELLPALLEQAGFPPASGLLATHADWDHLLGPIAFPQAALGCAESSAARLAAEPGRAQRELRAFDESLYVRRGQPLALGSLQALPVPGSCELGEDELELHPAEGHTGDGMAVLIGWAGVLVAGDYLSAVEIPTLGEGGGVADYLATLQRLQELLARAAYVVPGHGPVLDRAGALAVLAEDRDYLLALREHGARASLPAGRRGAEQRRLHEENVAALSRPSS